MEELAEQPDDLNKDIEAGTATPPAQIEKAGANSEGSGEAEDTGSEESDSGSGDEQAEEEEKGGKEEGGRDFNPSPE